MKTAAFAILTLFFTASAQQISAQSNVTSSNEKRPRIVASGSTATTQQQTTPTPTPTPYGSPSPTPSPRVVVKQNPPMPQNTPRPIIVGNPTPSPYYQPLPRPIPTATPYASSTPAIIYPTTPTAYTVKNTLTITQMRSKLTEARRLLQTRVTTIGQVQPSENVGISATVTIAALDMRTNQVQLIILPKTSYLTPNLDFGTITSLGRSARVRTIRANGVNTPVVVFDEYGQPMLPLLVQYPIEKFGRFSEMAYYTSAHPGLVTAETTRAGQIYLRTTIETALKKLRDRNIYISPQVIAEAEKLCLVEHVDHSRFLNENRAALYQEILTLFAFNEGNTYRYAVSSAGAGGLVQMIPATYRMMRNAHPNVQLIPDFVEGMRNHVNAAQAMLLYMQDTWSDLLASETITSALESGIARDEELMAAGYNSNPARLPLYVRRGGANWRTLIPRETKMYLQIQNSIDQTIIKLPPIK